MGLNPEHWVDDYGDFLYRYAYVRVNNAQIAEDLVQDALLSALKNASEFQNRSQERTWLVSILKNKIIDYYRKKKADFSIDDTLPSGELKDFAPDGQWKEALGPKNWEGDAQNRLEKEEIRAALLKCIGKLPEKWANIIRLRELEELPAEKIRNLLGITSSNLWVILHRARLELRRCLERLVMSEKKGKK